MLSLSDIHILLPQHESIYSHQVEADVRKFMERWQIMPHHFDDFNTLSRYIFPQTVSAKRLQVACAFNSMFFFIDDLCFDTHHLDAHDFSLELEFSKDLKFISQFLASLMDIFKTGELPDRPSKFQQALVEIREEIVQQAPTEWFDVFADSIQDYITAAIQREIDLSRENQTVLTDFNSFLDIRLHEGGGLQTCLFIELTKNAFLPAEIRNHVQIKNLTWSAIAMTSLVNDIFSYHKDVVVEGSDFNMVKILMDMQGLSFDEAVHESVQIVNNYAALFVEQCAQLPAWDEYGDWVVKQYVNGLAEMMSGNVYWHATTNRYRSPESPFTELQNMGGQAPEQSSNFDYIFI